MSFIKLPIKAVKFFKRNQNQILKSGNLVEGAWDYKLSEKIKKIANVKNAICVNSNGSGLVALLLIYKEYYGRTEVMIQSNTMYGVKTMTKTAGYNLVGFIDCQLETLMPSFEDLKKKIEKYKGNPKKLVILLSDIGGIINPDIQKIAKFCKNKNIILLEDAAHSFGSTLNKKFAGTFGDAGVYSYYATKAIFAGEGGVVVTNNNKIGKFMKDFTKYDRFNQKMNIGCNIRMSEMQALMTYSVVKEYKEIIYRKSQVARRYIDVCNNYNIEFINQNSKKYKGNYYKFIIISKNKDVTKLFSKLKTTTSKVYDYALGSSKNLPQKHLCLPIWYDLKKSVVDRVISEIIASTKT
jgi:perosamine synthetase